MLSELLVNLYNDLLNLDPNKLTLVKYDNKSHVLSYMQIGKVISTPYISHLYLPKKRFIYGILTQGGLQDLLNSLYDLVKDPSLDSGKIVISLSELRIEFYKSFSNDTIKSPQRIHTLNLVSITSKLLTTLILKTHSDESRILNKYRSSGGKN